jgi:flavin-dependent dehydrogenase
MKSITQKESFLIVGAGPSGLIMGIELLRLGYSVTILEKNHRQLRTVCGEYLTPKGKKLIQELALSQTLKDFLPLYGMTLYSPRGKKIPTQFPQNQTGVSVKRDLFQQRLEEEFVHLGGFVQREVEIQEINRSESGIVIQSRGVQFKSDFLIGADGRQSTVAKLLNIPTSNVLEKKVAIHCFLKPKTPLPRFGEMHILPNGSYIGINPITPTEVNFSLVTTLESIRTAGGVKELLNYWIDLKPELSALFHPIDQEVIKTISPITRGAQNITVSRTTLIGDASGFIDPLTGEGITTAISTAHLLAQEIKESSSIQLAFQNYEEKRKKDYKHKEWVNLRFQLLIKNTLACEIVALILESSERLRSVFIGMIGNVYTPLEAIWNLFIGHFSKRF